MQCLAIGSNVLGLMTSLVGDIVLSTGSFVLIGCQFEGGRWLRGSGLSLV